MLKVNKKGISEMVSYALLVIIAIGLAAGVYVYIRGYIPGDKRIECPSDISLAINNIDCRLADKTLTIEFQNNGLFNVTGVFVRMANESKKVRMNVNTNSRIFNAADLAPGISYAYMFNVSSIVTVAGTYGIDIQPSIRTKNGLAICSVNSYETICS